MFKENQIFCFMDYETTGVDTSISTKVRPIQIGCIYTDVWLNGICSYQSLIKWPEFLLWDGWPEETIDAYNVHKISFKEVMKGKWCSNVGKDLMEIDKEIRKSVTSKYKPVIISDAPNFEMFWTQMIFGGLVNKSVFPFHYNAWSIYPMVKLLDIKIGERPHDALSDAKLMLEGMREVYKKLNLKEQK